MLGAVLYARMGAKMAEICLPSLKLKVKRARCFDFCYLVSVRESDKITMLCKCKISCCRMVKLRGLDFASKQQCEGCRREQGSCICGCYEVRLSLL